MIIKQCQFRGRDSNGEYIHLLHPGYDNAGILKTAQVTSPQLAEINSTLGPLKKVKDENSIYVLVSALGASEYWGSNSNGDAFPEESLIHTPPGWNSMSLHRQRQEGKNWEWGYPTFYNAHAFQHHKNKDPARAFGSVIYSMWDSRMKRVLLVIKLNRAAASRHGAQGIIDKVENGEYVDVSMGTKVPFDLCSICSDWERIIPFIGSPKRLLAEHKKSPIRGLSVTKHDYCQHLQNEINIIYPDGRRVCMLNIHPRFFDLSFVYIGADKTSKVLAKLAGAKLCPIQSDTPMCKRGCYSCSIPSSHVYEVWSRRDKVKTAERAERSGAVKASTTEPKKESKKLTLDKKAEIVKQIRSNFSKSLPLMESDEPDIPMEILNTVQNVPEFLSSAGSMGIVVKPKEFQRIVLVSRGKPRVADELDRARVCFKPGAPPSEENMMGNIIPKILSMLRPLLMGRSSLAPVIHKRIISISARPVDSGCKLPLGLESDPVLNKIGSDYSAYRKQLINKFASLINCSANEHPWIVSDLFSHLPEEKILGGLVKAGSDVVESIVRMSTVDYINKAYLDKPASQYIDQNCDLGGLVTIGDLAL